MQLQRREDREPLQLPIVLFGSEDFFYLLFFEKKIWRFNFLIFFMYLRQKSALWRKQISKIYFVSDQSQADNFEAIFVNVENIFLETKI